MALDRWFRSLLTGWFMIFLLGSPALADNALYERARREGTVLVYSSFNAAEMNQLKETFEQRYPGVKVEHLRLAGAKLMQRILAENLAGKDMADTVLIKGETLYVLGQKGLLAKYDPLEQEPEVMDKMFKHPQNLWTTVYLGVHSIVYNTRTVPAKDIPRRYTDLLKPRWKDKIGVSTTKYIVTYALMDLYGKERGMDFLKKLAKQNPAARAGGTLIIELVGAGEFEAGFSVNADSVESVKRKGAPVDWARLEEPSYGDIQGTGVMAKARNPNAARLFASFLVSKEGQTKISDLSNVVTRKDVQPKIAIDRSKLRVIDPAEGNRIDYYMGLINDLFVKAN
jgi:iron(III) transport system substrate-binding protein